MEAIPKNQLARYLQRFIRYKSVTDPRVRARLQPVPSPLSRDQASRLAGDIITVAEFYDLPIELFLGIGSMENNYMNVRGDLNIRFGNVATVPIILCWSGNEAESEF